MKRRSFITLLGAAAAAAWQLAARAQQPAMPVIGFFSLGSSGAFATDLPAFRSGLKEEGFEEGSNVAFDFRWLPTEHDQAREAATELVSRRVHVIVATTSAVLAAKAATTTIPIIAVFGGDPVKAGFVASLNRPDSNLTGVGLFTFSLGPKRFELLRELVPSAKLIGVLVNPSQADPEARDDANEVEAAAHAVGQRISMLNASSAGDIDSAFATMVQQKAGALLVMADPIFSSRRQQIIALAARHAIPAIYEWGTIAQAGGLMSYGSNLSESIRHLGRYVGRVLKGAKPADLPVMRAVKIELVINLKTAKALGLTVPQTLLARADVVIE
jgi:putative tryptophan/tyrosine transport system substrate-binding protein